MREAPESSPRLALLDPGTGRIRLVEQALRGSVPLDWSDDRKRLLFSQPAGSQPQLFELELSSGDVRQLTRGPEAHPSGCYGAAGSVLAGAVELAPSGPRLYLVQIPPGGGPGTPLTEGPWDQRPTCAPGGGAVAWVREAPDSPPELRLAAPPGAPARELGPGTDPRFSPDGGTLVFTAPGKRVFSAGQVRPLWQLRRIRLDGTGRFSLGLSAIDERDPSFSPDGRLIVYVGVDAAFGRALYLRRADGSGDRLLFDTGDALTPVW